MDREETYTELLAGLNQITLLRYNMRKHFENTNLLRNYEHLLNILAIYETNIRNNADKINLTERV